MATSPTDIKFLGAVLNTDDSQEIIPNTHHKMAFNGVFRGNQGNYKFQSIQGTRGIPYTLPVGNNETIGSLYDPIKQAIIYFVYNSNQKHGIYYFNLKTEIITPLIVCGTNTVGDVLGFTLDNPIPSAKIIYGDAVTGDILVWINSQKQPCKLNIDTAFASGYGNVQRSYLDVAKEPPLKEICAVYENDNSVTINNLRKKLFIFKVLFEFDDLEKSVTSIHSEMPLPIYYSTQSIDADPTKNSVILITFPTQLANVKKIYILAAQSLGNVMSDFFTVEVLDKTLLNIPDNDIYIYKFYNNKAYNYYDVEQSIQLYDYVPLQANDQELLNGNTLIYAGILEGYDLVNGDIRTTQSLVSEKLRLKTEILFASNIGLTGNVIRIIVAGTASAGDVINVVTSVSASPTTITYTVSGGDTIASIISGLATSATGGGFTVVSTAANSLVVSKTNVKVDNFYITVASNSLVGNNSTFANDWNSIQNYGGVYFDEKGRTNGEVTDVSATISYGSYTETTDIPNIPKVTISIYNRPPIWAVSFSLVRTNDLSKSRILQWISDRTFKDTSTEPDNYKYAWISIENLNTFIKNNPNSPLGYDFAAGDRIRFIKAFLVEDGTTVTVIQTNKDFEIAAQVINPTINGTTYEGQFLKIVLPTTGITFDFGIQTHAPVTNPINYYNYFIEIYTPAQSVANGLDVGYEFGEMYSIFGSGTTLAYHQGMLQNQTQDLGTPATFEYTKGSYYYRDRTINAGAEYDYTNTDGTLQAGESTLGVSFVDQSYDDPNILPGSSPLQDLIGFNLASDLSRYLLWVQPAGGTYTFNIKGSIIVNFQDFGEIGRYILQKNDGTVYELIPNTDITQGTHTFTFDTNFTLAPNERIFIFWLSSMNFNNTKTYSTSSITITRQLSFTQGMVDPNFSDLYASAVNSNGRAFIFDPNARQTFFGTLLRWGLAFQQGTNINQINRFYALNFDQIDSQKGDIQRLIARERILRIFQSRGVGQMGVYTKFVQDSGGKQLLTTTDDIITTNNVNYYAGTHGLGDQYTALASNATSDCFIDSVTGDQIRLAQDGMISLNELYKGQYDIRSLFTEYNKTFTREDGAPARILMAWDYFENEWITVLQGGSRNCITIDAHYFTFNERRNAYSSFYDIYPEWILSAQDKIITWLAGGLYIHDNTDAYCNFYGIQYYPSITLVFNKEEIIKKTYRAVAYQSNRIWVSDTNGDILTSSVNEVTGENQKSSLTWPDYRIENLRYASFRRASNSTGGLEAGEFLHGNWIEVKFVYKSTEFAWIYLPYVLYELDPRNL